MEIILFSFLRYSTWLQDFFPSHDAVLRSIKRNVIRIYAHPSQGKCSLKSKRKCLKEKLSRIPFIWYQQWVSTGGRYFSGKTLHRGAHKNYQIITMICKHVQNFHMGYWFIICYPQVFYQLFPTSHRWQVALSGGESHWESQVS